jgi:alpha-tubulin suppressor-like RCC1 family protein
MGYNINGVDVTANLVPKERFVELFPLANDPNSPTPLPPPTLNPLNLWLWGSGYRGIQGDNTMEARAAPFPIAGLNWKQVALGSDFTTAIKTDGTLWVWGENTNGRLGDNSITHRSSPVQTIAGGTNWSEVATGITHTAAIRTNGTLWLWGNNTNGRLGDNTITSRSSPAQTVSGGTDWKQVACGDGHTAAIKTNGTLWTWGNNATGQLGSNNTTSRSSPAQTVSGGANWKQVACGNDFTAVIKTDDTLWLWGNNTSGQLGDNTRTHRSSPVQTIAGGTNWKQVSCGNTMAVAIKTDGTLWAWGNNIGGRLGDNTTVDKSSPVQTIAGGTNWRQVSAGKVNFTSAIKTDGTLWTWGTNSQRQLGDNTTINKSSPVQTIAGGNNWSQVSAGWEHTAGITGGSLNP